MSSWAFYRPNGPSPFDNYAVTFHRIRPWAAAASHSQALRDGKEEEGKAEMVGGNCLSLNPTHIESLPDDLLFKILVRLPAQDVCYAARFVCRLWYLMIHTRNFIYAHFEHTTCGLLVRGKHPIFVAMRQGRVEISNLSYNLSHRLWASSSGLILERDIKDRNSLYVANPVTKQHFVLPLFSEGIYYPFPGIAYASTSMEYKVAAMYASWDSNINAFTSQFAILTVGVDNAWRQVHTEHSSRIMDAEEFWQDSLLNTEGFMHWVVQDTHVFTLNVETETITETPVPHHVHGETVGRFYLSTGKCLSLLTGCELKWEVWEMKPETGELTKLPNINLEAQKCKLERYHHLIPIGWLKHQEVLVFDIYYPSRACVAYNIHTQEIHFFELDCCADLRKSVVHRSSLVWLKGLSV